MPRTSRVVDAVGLAGGVERAAHAFEVLQRRFAQVVHQLRRRLHQRLHRRVLGVEDAQRVAVQRGAAPRRRARRACASKCAISAARCARRSSGWPRQLSSSRTSRQAEVAPQARHIRMTSASTSGPAIAERLDADLVELPVAPALRPLVAEHRAHVVQALAAVVEHRVLDRGAHHAGRALGAQRERVAVHAVVEGVHLLLDDVGHLAQAAHEQRRGLDDGRADVAVAVARASARARCLRTTPSAPNRAAGCRSCL